MTQSNQTVPSAFTSRSVKKWILVVGCLTVAGLAVGNVLPITSPIVTEPSAENGEASQLPATAESDSGAAQIRPAVSPKVNRIHEFPLSTADIRDTQEAPVATVDRHNAIYVAWASKTAEGERSLFLAISGDSGKSFSGLRMIRKSGIFKSSSESKGKNGGFERRMVPLLAAYADTVLLAWNEAPADGSAIRMMLAESRDGGQSFGEAIRVHHSNDARPTFSGLAVNARGRVACTWLDSRNGQQQPFGAVRRADGEAFADELLIFAGQHGAGVCPCCPTTAAVADDGTVFVAFRNQLDGYRDIWLSVLRPSAGAFSEPTPIVSPTWQFDGCPHDGPSLAICGGHLHVAWMDAHSGRQRAYYARAPLEDLRFAVQDLNPHGPGTQGNVKLCADPAGRLHAVWEESLIDEPAQAKTQGAGGHHLHGPPTGAGRVVVYSSSREADGHFDAARPIAPQPGRFQTRPAIACGPSGGLVVAWNELDDSGKHVVVACLSDVSDSTARLPRTAER
jgi:hypothetical protein